MIDLEKYIVRYVCIVHKYTVKNTFPIEFLHLYIKTISRCLGIVVILSERRQDHQLNNLIKCYTFLKVDYI